MGFHTSVFLYSSPSFAPLLSAPWFNGPARPEGSGGWSKGWLCRRRVSRQMASNRPANRKQGGRSDGVDVCTQCCCTHSRTFVRTQALRKQVHISETKGCSLVRLNAQWHGHWIATQDPPVRVQVHQQSLKAYGADQADPWEDCSRAHEVHADLEVGVCKRWSRFDSDSLGSVMARNYLGHMQLYLVTKQCAWVIKRPSLDHARFATRLLCQTWSSYSCLLFLKFVIFFVSFRFSKRVFLIRGGREALPSLSVDFCKPHWRRKLFISGSGRDSVDVRHLPPKAAKISRACVESS